MKMNLLKWTGIALFVIGIFFASTGFEKKDNYCYDSSYCEDHNAYVGGDAYNYIINANYFTGYVVLGSCFMLGGLIFFASGEVVVALNGSNKNSDPIVNNANKVSTENEIKF